MRVCYIWIEKFKNLSNYDLNLASDYNFHFDKNYNELTYQKKTKIPQELFDDQISDVTALLGINGSGKTTSLELICRCVKDQVHMNNNYILVYEAEGHFYLSTNLTESIKTPSMINGDNNNSYLKELRTIFFSNVFDENFIDFPEEIIDISINTKMNPKVMYKRKRKTLEGDIEKQIRFLGSSAYTDINLTPPSKIEYRINRSSNLSFKPGYRREYYANNKAQDPDKSKILIEKLRHVFAKEIIGLNRRDYLKFVATQIKHYFIISLIQPLNETPFSPEIIEEVLLKYINEKTTTYDLFVAILNESKTNEKIYTYSGEHLLSEVIEFIILKIEVLLESFGFEADQSIRGSRLKFCLDINELNSWHHQKLANIFESIVGCSVSWIDLSSGQKAYFNMFSSIWASLENLNYDFDNLHTLICIDEADLYLHPQWQIEFIETVLKCLPKLSRGKIQIVFTTHSPMLVSDIPKQCISLLNPNQSGNEEKVEICSFGANLYDIYEKAFGLTDYRTGSISSKYITNILSIIGQSSLLESDIEKLNTALEVIDDTLILHHINQRLVKND